jgi:AcrR family transcriptional regulator
VQIVDGADCRTDVEHQGLLSGSVAEIGIERGDESIREVARKAGVSHQAPYYYFRGREAILAAIAGAYFKKLGEALEHAVAKEGSKPVESVEAIGRAYVEFALRNPA